MDNTLIIHDWNSQCGECGYGGRSWTESPALRGEPILYTDSKECPNCKCKFTKFHIEDENSYMRI